MAYWLITFCAGMLLSCLTSERSLLTLALASWALLLSIVALARIVGVI